MRGRWGVIGAGEDGIPRVVALGDGLLAIGMAVHIRGAQMGRITGLAEKR